MCSVYLAWLAYFLLAVELCYEIPVSAVPIPAVPNSALPISVVPIPEYAPTPITINIPVPAPTPVLAHIPAPLPATESDCWSQILGSANTDPQCGIGSDVLSADWFPSTSTCLKYCQTIEIEEVKVISHQQNEHCSCLSSCAFSTELGSPATTWVKGGCDCSMKDFNGTATSFGDLQIAGDCSGTEEETQCLFDYKGDPSKIFEVQFVRVPIISGSSYQRGFEIRGLWNSVEHPDGSAFLWTLSADICGCFAGCYRKFGEVDPIDSCDDVPPENIWVCITCEDDSQYASRCPDWAVDGECEVSPNWMISHCCASCGAYQDCASESLRALLNETEMFGVDNIDSCNVTNQAELCQSWSCIDGALPATDALVSCGPLGWEIDVPDLCVCPDIPGYDLFDKFGHTDGECHEAGPVKCADDCTADSSCVAYDWNMKLNLCCKWADTFPLVSVSDTCHYVQNSNLECQDIPGYTVRESSSLLHVECAPNATFYSCSTLCSLLFNCTAFHHDFDSENCCLQKTSLGTNRTASMSLPCIYDRNPIEEFNCDLNVSGFTLDEDKPVGYYVLQPRSFNNHALYKNVFNSIYLYFSPENGDWSLDSDLFDRSAYAFVPTDEHPFADYLYYTPVDVFWMEFDGSGYLKSPYMKVECIYSDCDVCECQPGLDKCPSMPSKYTDIWGWNSAEKRCQLNYTMPTDSELIEGNCWNCASEVGVDLPHNLITDCKALNHNESCKLQCEDSYVLTVDGRPLTYRESPDVKCIGGQLNQRFECHKQCDFKELTKYRMVIPAPENECTIMLAEDKCAVTCSDSAELKGERVLTCKEDGYFEEELPKCQVSIAEPVAVFTIFLFSALLINALQYFYFLQWTSFYLFAVFFSLFDFVSSWIAIDYLSKMVDSSNDWARDAALAFLSWVLFSNIIAMLVSLPRNDSFKLWAKDHTRYAAIIILAGFTNVFAFLIPSSRVFNVSDLSSSEAPATLRIWKYMGVIDVILLIVPQFIFQIILALEPTIDVTDEVAWSLVSSAASCLFVILSPILISVLFCCDPMDESRKLHICAKYGMPEDITALLLAGADIDALDKEGRTALMDACYMGREDTPKALLDNSADIDKKDQRGNTSLHMAVYRRHHAVIQILQLYLPSYHIENKKEQTVFDIAFRSKKDPLKTHSYLAEYFCFAKPKMILFKDLANVTVLDEGQYGKVYRARLIAGKTRDGNAYVDVVCKVSHGEAGSNEWYELQNLRNLPPHPNVVGLLALCTDFGYNKKQSAMVMLFKAGGSLLNYCVRKKGMISMTRIVSFGIDMVRGVLLLHENGYKHCDIAARNFLMTQDEFTDPDHQRIAITDFGLCRKFDEKHEKHTRYPLQWCAPEMSFSCSNKETDIWMLGCTLYEFSLDFYARPFDFPPFISWKSHVEELKQSRKTLMFTNVSRRTLDTRWIDIVHQCTTTDPKHRPDAKALLGHMQQLQKKDTWNTTDGIADLHESISAQKTEVDNSFNDIGVYNYESPDNSESADSIEALASKTGVYREIPTELLRYASHASSVSEQKDETKVPEIELENDSAGTKYSTMSRDSVVRTSESKIAIIPSVVEMVLKQKLDEYESDPPQHFDEEDDGSDTVAGSNTAPKPQ